MKTRRPTICLALTAIFSLTEWSLGLEARVSVEELPRLTRAAIEVSSSPAEEDVGGVELAIEPSRSLSVDDIMIFLPNSGGWSRAKPALVRDHGMIRAIVVAPAEARNSNTARNTVMTIVFDTDTAVRVRELSDIVKSLRIMRTVNATGEEIAPRLVTRFEGTKAVNEQESLAKTAQAEYRRRGRRHTMRFYLPREMHVRATVTDARGMAVAHLLDRTVGIGVHAVSWTEAEVSKTMGRAAPCFMQIEMGSTVLSTKVNRVADATPADHEGSEGRESLRDGAAGERGLAAALGRASVPGR